MTDTDGAPIYGGVTDPADISGPGIRMSEPCMSCGQNIYESPPGRCLHQANHASPVPLPRYTTTTSIAACPHCYGDLDYEGDGYWCPPCQRSWNFTQVVLYEDNERDD